MNEKADRETNLVVNKTWYVKSGSLRWESRLIYKKGNLCTWNLKEPHGRDQEDN